MFGITETTVHVTAQEVGRREALAGSRSVGTALPGWSVYVLDPHGRLLPPGAAGEICVGGAGVAAGYLGRTELTTERFGPDPFGGGRMYRSGDRGRLLPDGRLEHLGRLDDQVQLRGHRIELGEVRVRLLDAPGVGAAAVRLAKAVPGDPATARIDGYVVFRGPDGDPDEVRRHAARFLPDYMVPSTVTPQPALPLTSNGKVDIARLPAPAVGGSPAGPDTSADGADPVRAAWETVFGVRVGPEDGFLRARRQLAAGGPAGRRAPLGRPADHGAASLPAPHGPWHDRTARRPRPAAGDGMSTPRKRSARGCAPRFRGDPA